MPRGGARPGTGGRRPGSGRKPGTPNKATIARQAEVKASGLTPLEVMLDNMRFHQQQAALARRRKGKGSREAEIAHRAAAEDSANRAAPYVHPRLSAVQMNGNLTLTHEERLEKLK
jgi:hypothetical protein